MSAKPIIIIVFFVISAIALVIFGNMDDSLSRKQYVTDGTYLSVFEAGNQGSITGDSQKYFSFKLADGSVVNIESPLLSGAEKKPKPGEKAKIHYRKGYFTKRNIYDSFSFYDGPEGRN